MVLKTLVFIQNFKVKVHANLGEKKSTQAF